MAGANRGVERPGWSLLSNHGHVVIALAREPGLRLREIADRVGITDRAVQHIVKDLESARYIRITRAGRRNQYELCPDAPLRHPLHDGYVLNDVLAGLTRRSGSAA